MNREELAQAIVKKVNENIDQLKELWKNSSPIKSFYLDNVLPEDIVKDLSARFPKAKELYMRRSIREKKKIGVDLHKYDPIVGEFLHAFQHPDVIKAVSAITELDHLNLVGDPSFYASGISMMEQGDFLNPHLDNSHDADGKLYRVLNILFYVGADWKLENGGNLELWDKDVKEAQTIISKFNRLAVMLVSQHSWHSVSRVKSETPRLCVSNYYFSEKTPAETDYSHLTTFMGRPEEKTKRAVLNADVVFRKVLGKAFPIVRKFTSHKIDEK